MQAYEHAKETALTAQLAQPMLRQSHGGACGVGEASADETDAHDTRCRAGKGHVPLKARADGAFEDDEQVVRTPLVDSEPAGREAQADELRGHQRAKGIRLLVQQAADGARLAEATRERAVDKVERNKK